LGIVKAFLSANRNGYIVAGASGLTNTLRLKHSNPIVNLPGVDKPYGSEIRSLLVSGNQQFIGADMVSLEDNTKRHYMQPYDPEYVKEMSQEGFDPHLNLALFAGEVTQEEIDDYNRGLRPDLKAVRKDFKVVNYSATYGVGATKLARESGMTVKKAKRLLDAFWDRNKAITMTTKAVRTKTLRDGSMWLFNPVSKFWYSLRNERDIFSTLNQGTGVYCFDTWLMFVTRKGYWPVMQYHDEALWINQDGLEEKLHEAIRETNEKLQLNVSLSVDPAVGHNYAEVH
jgi:DNA polymerase I-like protein with 3'-5' exonuclease and polymerase domains